MSDTISFVISIKRSDYATLSKVYALLADKNVRVLNESGPVTSTASAPDPLEPKRRGRPPKGSANTPPALNAKRRGRPPGSGRKAQAALAPPGPTTDNSGDLEEKFSKWHAGQRLQNGRGKYFTAGEVKALMPVWEATLATYQAAAGHAASAGRSTKSWSIARLRRETNALVDRGSTSDKEGSPVSSASMSKAKAKSKSQSKAKTTRRLRSRITRKS